MILEGINVIDLTARLPGPYAGYILSTMGAKVLKVENIRHPDAFSEENLQKLEPIFSHWYQSLNEVKQKQYLDFDQKDDLEKLHELFSNAHIVLIPNKDKVIDLIGLKEIAKKFNLAVITVGGSHKGNQSMHDLNALALMPAFKMHIKENEKPPFLPIAGISYGHQIATEALGVYLKCLREKKSIFYECFLDLSTQKLYSPFWDESLTECDKHLHNGRFPCYNLYKTQDGATIAVAAVEDKFWNIFIKTFELPLTLDDRYDTSQRVFKIIAKKFATFTTEEAKTKLDGQDICVTIID